MMLEEAQKQIALSKNYNATAQVNAFQPTTSKTLHEQSNKKWAANDSYSTESELDDSNKENEDSNKQKKNRNKDRDDNKIEQDNNYVNDEKDKPEQLIVIMDNDHGEDLEDSDLYGKDWPNDKMVKLMDKVYCKESDLKLAISLSSQATHVARRLVTGVFKPSGYLNATFTGQAPRAHKHEGQLVPVKPLNEVARNEIVDYALHRASMKQWKSNKGIPQTREQVQRAMSQRIGELKRSYELTKNTKHS